MLQDTYCKKHAGIMYVIIDFYILTMLQVTFLFMA